MSYALYITHPEVILEEGVLPTRWHLSSRGRERAAAFALSSAMQPIKLIIASAEAKTLETAELLAAAGAEVVVGENFHENVRPVAGIMRHERLELLLDALYAQPHLSPGGGWETAAATAARIVAATGDAVRRYAGRAPLALVGHGTVGTLLKCHLADSPAIRDEDQRRVAHPGGGNVFAFSLPDMRLLTDWIAIEKFSRVPL
jgi:broad specificity phosphatase PhoE